MTLITFSCKIRVSLRTICPQESKQSGSIPSPLIMDAKVLIGGGDADMICSRCFWRFVGSLIVAVRRRRDEIFLYILAGYHDCDDVSSAPTSGQFVNTGNYRSMKMYA